MNPAVPAAVPAALRSAKGWIVGHPFLALFALANLYPTWLALSFAGRLLAPALLPVAGAALALALTAVVLVYAGARGSWGAHSGQLPPHKLRC